MYEKLIVLIASVVFVGCSHRQDIKAKIIERKELSSDRLLIAFEYVADNKTYIDSVTVKNRVINTDSIIVTIDPSNPGSAIPDFNAK